jgi:cytochrome c-type biogenesis protein CcmH/NrfF
VKRWLPYLALAVVIVVALVIGTRGSGPESVDARAAAIEAEVMCPQCNGESALASNAPAARAVRQFVTQQVEAGQSNSQIEGELRDSYGADILLRPPSTGIGALVWEIPIVVLVVAVLGLALAFRRWRAITPTPVSDEDRARVEQALGERKRDG